MHRYTSGEHFRGRVQLLNVFRGRCTWEKLARVIAYSRLLNSGFLNIFWDSELQKLQFNDLETWLLFLVKNFNYNGLKTVVQMTELYLRIFKPVYTVLCPMKRLAPFRNHRDVRLMHHNNDTYAQYITWCMRILYDSISKRHSLEYLWVYALKLNVRERWTSQWI